MQMLQVLEVAQLRRNLAVQSGLCEAKGFQPLRFPNHGGIAPIRLLPERSKRLNADRLPNPGGIGPLRLLELRSSEVTRPSSFTATPVPMPKRMVRHPVAAVLPLRAARCLVQCHQRPPVPDSPP